MREVFGYVATGIVSLLFGLTVGLNETPSGKVEVPAKEGTPADLPGWACSEIVNARLERWLESTGRDKPTSVERIRGRYYGVRHYPVLDVCPEEPFE